MKRNSLLCTLTLTLLISYPLAIKAQVPTDTLSSKVNAHQMKKGAMTSALDVLSGQTAGVQVETGGNQEVMVSAVRVRGTTSLTGGNDPLVIIDGVASDLATLSTIYPADIESFTILKNAAETSQYGSRGASGVIQVATKRGKGGQFHISYDGNFGVESVYKRLHMLSADEFRAAADKMGLGLYDGGSSTNFQKEILRTGTVQNHHVAFGGGTDDRVTLPVVAFVLAKLYLNAEVYGAGPHWEETLEMCDLVRQLGYRLADDYNDNFLVNNEGSPENIWIIPMDHALYNNYQHNIVRSMHWRHADACDYLGENGTSATLTVLRANDFEEEDEDKRFNDNYWGNFAYDFNSLRVADRSGEVLQYAPWEVRYDMKGSAYLETAGARMHKYELDRDASHKGDLVDNDIVLFRYADVLLMQAEAKVRLGESGQTEMNLIRERAHMPTIDATLDNIYDERLRELAWEGWRRNDMIRFGRYKSEATPNTRVDESDGHTILFPIPSYAMATNPNLVQNPGY